MGDGSATGMKIEEFRVIFSPIRQDNKKEHENTICVAAGHSKYEDSDPWPNL